MEIAFKKQLEPVEGLVHIDIVMIIGEAMDTDGPFKPIFDALQLAGVIKNDNLNHSGTYDRFDREGNTDTIVVSVRKLERTNDHSDQQKE